MREFYSYAPSQKKKNNITQLRPKKSKCQPFLITFSKNDDLPKIINIAHELRQTGLITHDLRLRQILLDSSILPRDSQSTPTTHTPSSLAQELELDYWNLYGVLGQPEQLRPAVWTAIKSSFNEVEGAKFHLLDETSSPKFIRHVTDRSAPRFSTSMDTQDMMTSHESNNSSIMCTQKSRIISGITASKMHQVSGKNCLKAKQTPLTEFVITETALYQNTHIQFSTNYSNIGRNILNLMQGMLNDCIGNGWENFNTHPFLMDRMNSTLRSGSGTGGESESEFWSREIVLAVKDVVDKNGILAPGRFGVWSRFAFTEAWDVVVEDDFFEV